MATMIDATVGGANSNSYVTTDAAIAYFAQRLRSDAWMAAATADREKALLMACRNIEAARPRVDRGTTGVLAPSSPNQVLSFPRVRDSKSGAGYYVPQPVKDAQCEEALALLAGGTEADRRRTLQAAGVRSFSIDGLTETYGEGTSKSPIVSAEARALLAPYLRRTGVIATSDLAQGEFTPGSQQ
jgi:hypothetical protein